MEIDNITASIYALTLQTRRDLGLKDKTVRKDTVAINNNYMVNSISRDYIFEEGENKEQNRPYTPSGESSFEKIINKHINTLA